MFGWINVYGCSYWTRENLLLYLNLVLMRICVSKNIFTYKTVKNCRPVIIQIERERGRERQSKREREEKVLPCTMYVNVPVSWLIYIFIHSVLYLDTLNVYSFLIYWFRKHLLLVIVTCTAVQQTQLYNTSQCCDWLMKCTGNMFTCVIYCMNVCYIQLSNNQLRELIVQ